MQRVFIVLLFYKPFIWWSFCINVIMGFFNMHLGLAVVIKLFLLVFLWYYMKETNQKRRLIFFKNLGISSIRLYLTVFLIDLFLTLTFLALFQEFT